MTDTIKINWAEWKIRYDEMSKRPTPDHPDVPSTKPYEHINGPKVKMTYAIGSVEWNEQKKGGTG